MNKPAARTPYIVGIGTSARGLEAVRELVSGLDDDPGLAFIVVQHLSPDHTSNLVDLLQDVSNLPVEPAEDGTVVEVDHIYVISPGDRLTYRDGTLQTEPLPELESARDTIDVLLRALAEELGTRAIGILLSGAGRDGTAGLRLLKQHGGIAIAQDPEEAGVRSMPDHAIEAGLVDFIEHVADIPDRLADLTASDRPFAPTVSSGEPTGSRARTLEEIVELVQDATGNDLSNYKRSTLSRRIARRMQVERIDTLEAFRDFLASNPEEIPALLEEMLIKVTGFFRDSNAWHALRDNVLPALFDGKGPDDDVRVWVPGCSTGEEAFSIAMLLHDYARNLERPPEIDVFATDIDPTAIEHARDGSYPTAVATDVPPDYLKSYFRVEDGAYRIVEGIRNRVVFASQNALTDPPFSELDLVTCRNLLIYLQPEAQQRLLKLFHYGLDDSGYLMLGASETVSSAAELFETFDEPHSIYRKREADPEQVVPGTVFGFETHDDTDAASEQPLVEPTPDLDDFHRNAALETQDVGSILVDRDRRLLHTVGTTSPYLEVPAGEPTDKVTDMLRDRFRSTVGDMLIGAFSDDEEHLERHLRADAETESRAVEIRADRLEDGPFDEPVVSVTFRPLSHPPAPQLPSRPLDGDEQSIVDQYEKKLDGMRERLEETTREYQSSNERLRASNEELMSMNEELQSTTEELETSKEELQSLNEELQSVNAELNRKIQELDATNTDLRNLMRSTNVGTLFLDRDLRIERFTTPVGELFNIHDADQGRPLTDLTHSLKMDSIAEDARHVLDVVGTVEREVETDDGRWFLFRALPYLSLDDTVDGVVLTFVDITERRRIQQALAEREKKFRTVFESAADPMVLYRIEDGEPQTLIDVNAATVEKTGRTSKQLLEMSIEDLLHGEAFDLDRHLDPLERDETSSVEARLTTTDPDRSVPVEVTATQVVIDGSTTVVAVLRDVTAQRRYEQTLRESKKRAEQLAELRSMFLSTLSHDVRTPITTILMAATVMRERSEDDRQLEQLDSIERSCRQLKQILDSILRMAKFETRESTADPERFDIVDKIREVLDLHAPLAEREDLELTYEGPDSPVEATIDPRFTTQILNNLVDNAIKYTDEGGVTVRVLVDDDRLTIEVVDTGVGIADEDRELIFERFESASSIDTHRFDSTGLGLAITRLLVDAMQGDIEVRSAPDEGSTFRVDLPRELMLDDDGDERRDR